MKDMKNEEMKAMELNSEELDGVTGGVYTGPCFPYKVGQDGVHPVLSQGYGVPAVGPDITDHAQRKD